MSEKLDLILWINLHAWSRFIVQKSPCNFLTFVNVVEFHYGRPPQKEISLVDTSNTLNDIRSGSGWWIHMCTQEWPVVLAETWNNDQIGDIYLLINHGLQPRIEASVSHIWPSRFTAVKMFDTFCSETSPFIDFCNNVQHCEIPISLSFVSWQLLSSLSCNFQNIQGLQRILQISTVYIIVIQNIWSKTTWHHSLL